MSELSTELQITIGGKAHTLSLKLPKTAGADWKRNAAFRRLLAGMKQTEYADIIEDDAILNNLYYLMTMIAGLQTHDLPIEIPPLSATGETFVTFALTVLEFDKDDLSSLIKKIKALDDGVVESETAPPHEVSENEKND